LLWEIILPRPRSPTTLVTPLAAVRLVDAHGLLKCAHISAFIWEALLWLPVPENIRFKLETRRLCTTLCLGQLLHGLDRLHVGLFTPRSPNSPLGCQRPIGYLFLARYLLVVPRMLSAA